jgi:hypothetical protein
VWRITDFPRISNLPRTGRAAGPAIRRACRRRRRRGRGRPAHCQWKTTHKTLRKDLLLYYRKPWRSRRMNIRRRHPSLTYEIGRPGPQGTLRRRSLPSCRRTAPPAAFRLGRRSYSL